jgi:hypothetical protein
MRKLNWVLPALVLVGGVMLTPRESAAKPDYTKKERKPCTYCHLGSWDSAKYTEAGEYYKQHNTLRGFVAKQEKDKAKQQPKQQAQDKK